MSSRPDATLERFWAPERKAWPVGLAAGLAAFALYAATAGSLVYTFDPAEFQTMARTGGVAHSGYPTLVLLLQAFGQLPLGTLAWRANLLSVVCGAGAVAVLAYVACRFTGRAVPALAAAATFACGLSMWKEATLAGVHALTLALDATLFVLALRFAHAPRIALAALGGLLFGIGVTCHLTVLGLALPLLLAFVHGARRLVRWRLATVALMLGFVVGLAPFTYTLAVDRPDQPMNYLHDTLEPGATAFAVERPDLGQRVARLGWLLSGRQYIGEDRRDAPTLARRASHLGLALLLNELPFAALVIALAGLALVVRAGLPGRMALAWLLGTLLLVGVGATELTLRFFFLPGTWLLALGLAAALAALGRRSRPALAVAIALVLASVVARRTMPAAPPPFDRFAMGRHLWRLSPEDWDPFHESRRYDAYGRGAIERLPARAVVLAGLWNEAMTLRYFVLGERRRPDVDVRLAGRAAPRLTRMWREAVAEGRPVFVTQEPEPGALGDARLEMVWDPGWGRLWRVVPGVP